MSWLSSVDIDRKSRLLVLVDRCRWTCNFQKSFYAFTELSELDLSSTLWVKSSNNCSDRLVCGRIQTGIAEMFGGDVDEPIDRNEAGFIAVQQVEDRLQSVGFIGRHRFHVVSVVDIHLNRQDKGRSNISRNYATAIGDGDGCSLIID